MDQETLFAVLGPYEGQELWDYALYGLMLFQIILLFVLFSSDSLRDTIMIAIVVVSAFLDKTYVLGFYDPLCSPEYNLDTAVACHTQRAFTTYVVRVIMFTIPIVLVTQTKIKVARYFAVFIAIYGLIYSFGRWFMQQRNSNWGGEIETNVMTVYASALVLMLIYHTLRRMGWFRRPQDIE